ncbi:MAG: DUF3558 family protein [Candidatus Limnocylindria bacterium]
MCLVGVIALAACGGNGGEPESSAAAPAASSAAPAPSPGLIPAETIASCAGFTADKAAVLLGLPPDSVKDSSENVGSARHCTFSNPKDRSAGIAFTLSARDSVKRAEASLESERQAMGQAQRAIDGVTGKSSKAPASEDVSGIGDGAFYSSMNGTIMLRVGNVLAQVSAPQDMGLKKQVAQEVARGLRP